MRIRNLTCHKWECEFSTSQFHNSHKFIVLYSTASKDEGEKELYYSINNNKQIIFSKKFKIFSLIWLLFCLFIIIQVMTVIPSKMKPENLGSTDTFPFLQTILLPTLSTQPINHHVLSISNILFESRILCLSSQAKYSRQLV